MKTKRQLLAMIWDAESEKAIIKVEKFLEKNKTEITEAYGEEFMDKLELTLNYVKYYEEEQQ